VRGQCQQVIRLNDVTPSFALAHPLVSLYLKTVVLNTVLGALAFLSLVLLLWQWFVAIRFPLHQRVENSVFSPAVTLLKPLKGCDPTTEASLRTWFTQDYAGPIQTLFGIASADDPVCDIVRKLSAEFSSRDAQLIVCGPLTGANAKVSKLIELERLAKHETLVISDADVRVPPDFLANLVARFQCNADIPVGVPVVDSLSPSDGERDRVRGSFHSQADTNPPKHSLTPQSSPSIENPKSKIKNQVGLINCFYLLANPSTLAMQWEAVAINADFWSQVLQARSLKPIDFALGAVMAVRKQQLAEIGGFTALADCLADDYQLGNRIARKGYRIALSTVPVECWSEPMGWSAVWKHQLRWGRTVRVCQPLPYFFSILSNPTLWPLLWVAVKPSPISLGFFLVSVVLRILTAWQLQHRLSFSRITHLSSVALLAKEDHAPVLRSAFGEGGSRITFPPWLPPVKDLLQTAIWFLAFIGNYVEWRGQRMRLRRDGTLVKPET
jgi:ceramide glucosyltransferase